MPKITPLFRKDLTFEQKNNIINTIIGESYCDPIKRVELMNNNILMPQDFDFDDDNSVSASGIMRSMFIIELTILKKHIDDLFNLKATQEVGISKVSCGTIIFLDTKRIGEFKNLNFQRVFQHVYNEMNIMEAIDKQVEFLPAIGTCEDGIAFILIMLNTKLALKELDKGMYDGMNV